MVSWNICETEFWKKWNARLKQKDKICECIKVSVGWVLRPISKMGFEFGACNRPTSNAHPETFRKKIDKNISIPVPDNFFFFWDWDWEFLFKYFSKRLWVSIWRWAVASGGTCTKLKNPLQRLASKLNLWIPWYTYIFHVFASSSKTRFEFRFIIASFGGFTPSLFFTLFERFQQIIMMNGAMMRTRS